MSVRDIQLHLDDLYGYELSTQTISNITVSWTNHWAELSTFFKYSDSVRKLIYTTNPIKSLKIVKVYSQHIIAKVLGMAQSTINGIVKRYGQYDYVHMTLVLLSKSQVE